MFKKITSLALALCLTFSMIISYNAKVEAANDGFVYTDGTKFICDGKYFYVSGTNAYDLFTKQYGGGSGITIDKAEIDNRMAQMEAIGMNVIRVWGFGATGGYKFEDGPNQYNEGTFTVMDYVLYSAEQHNIKVIITLENYWGDYGGIDEKLSWAGASGGSHAARRAWYSNAKCQSWYKNYFNYFANRVNTFTKETYKDDTTIFAWDMMNEARYQNDSNYSDPENTQSKNLRNWVDTTGAYMKSIDPNHMICIGIEGHGSKYGFGGNEGNDFTYVQQSEYLDFCCAHPYPDEYWADLSPAQTKTLVEKWITDAHTKCQKPLLITEFNVDKQAKNIEDYWKAVYDTLDENDAGGALFWCYDTRELSHFAMVQNDAVIKGYFTNYCAKINAKNVAIDMTQVSPSRINIDTSSEIKDQTVTLTYYGSDSLTAIKNGDKTLAEGKAYTVNENKVTFKADFIKTLAEGTTTLTLVVGEKNPNVVLYLYDGSTVDTGDDTSDTDSQEEQYDFWYVKFQCERDFSYSGADWQHEACSYGGANCIRARGDTGSVSIDLPENETYTFNLRAGSMYDKMSVTMKIDGANAGTFSVAAAGDKLNDNTLTATLSAGKHTVSLTYPDVYNSGCDYLMITCDAIEVDTDIASDSDIESDTETSSDSDTESDTDTAPIDTDDMYTDVDSQTDSENASDTENVTDSENDTQDDIQTDIDTNADSESDTDTKLALGDVNGDGVVDIIDVALIRSHIVGNNLITDKEKATRADVNKDLIIDIIDVALIRNQIVNGK